MSMVDDEPFVGPEQLVGNDQRADGLVAGAAAGVADDMGVTLGEQRTAEAPATWRVRPKMTELDLGAFWLAG